ncbi:MAG: DNA-3-methyladenine glycosylase 2 family protein [Pyrinomonadaceae bacterium]|nr:DNA-3-methyladenine glycosylase 2 family protein [Pyrinomonadaceae bacterium]
MDKDLGHVFRTYGAPPLWDREPSYATLVHIILEQQVSLASALSAFNKLKDKVGKITPEKVLKLSDAEMKACYFSRQKMGYARDLANAIQKDRMDLEALNELSNEDATAELKKIKGIGDWTAQVYLLMVLLRVDIMPRGDLALHAAYQKLIGLDKRPKSDEFIETAKKWAPYRSVAARLLWHFYLSNK